MANILEKIVADKRIEVEQLKQDIPLASFIDDLKPTQKDMYAALAQPNAGFIFECKKASPSKGLIRPVFDVLEISSVYKKYASAISVLTDAKYFQGNHDYLKAVSENVDCPVLNKDFFVDSYQIHLGRYYGADAILLMLSVLTDEEYIELANVANSYNMAILTEVSNVEETVRAIDLGAKLIGINNRNLRDLSTDLTRTFELAPMIPDDRLIISESGIYTNKQVRELAPAVNGFLVGSSIMSEDDIDLACRQVVYGSHKVCGLTKASDVVNVINAGACFAGLIFADKSPRCVTLEQAQDIINEVNNSVSASINYVGVFANEHLEVVAKTANKLNLAAVQLHGSEDGDYISELRKLLDSNTSIVKAISVKDDIAPLDLGADSYLLDSKQGGSGEAFNWQLLAECEQDLSKTMLAGGLNTENLADAIRLMNDTDISGLDINSGIEISPGIKDKTKLEQAFSLLRHY
ncbi:bifunctional indole-3-glycerol-phosphate synthase TrpC/phosphoribosylanthranilate isomerase TrpF [Thalassomonas sp. M1454]|uniref:bifunctional indole-3-glycerol-phosphate synthase TrpC/phosphoribosylanthranilate isomerase TrpF n=1 Tax=Thalassomonas sp. M1454 TaxID=2594477 RepID=UPI00117D92AF|nr:bifunctional indole-3-glycerol-phosphate synthase TrpC/phosphoribosylanthranilate isomerase TrpF [Thalassomonas sp. M1454]TRX55735.1 bifunctional indole-3-glycerol-phosphate synthase TrpC/phosphoribosylanthranilate isomerase TrpF [Thalassomonas sp. M1454]